MSLHRLLFLLSLLLPVLSAAHSPDGVEHMRGHSHFHDPSLTPQLSYAIDQTNCGTTGQQKALVIAVNFIDNASEPVSLNTVPDSPTRFRLALPICRVGVTFSLVTEPLAS